MNQFNYLQISYVIRRFSLFDPWTYCSDCTTGRKYGDYKI